ncbi:MAG TPA: maleylpyruvate isomerase N-terminal domain-containing protein [Thermoanaerobaculia bacterium]|nr:maleylpyruvate isomerase N-terminal domain-containing protein [Thermoanaerobaculia bacterium]
MSSPQPILAAPLFVPLNDELTRLLQGLTPEEWNTRAVGTWSVKDVAAHLLDTAFRRLSAQRDRYAPPFAPTQDLAAFINEANAQWVSATRRISPPILIELIDRSGRDLADYLMTLDPYAPAEWAVSWAGEKTSPNWFDTARELTERWHHQQQIRDAAGRPPLYDVRYLKPVIDTFLRALPFAYRNAPASDGTRITFAVQDVTRCSLVRDAGKWSLDCSSNGEATTTVGMSGDTAWRLFTKGLGRDEARRRSEIAGNAALAEPLFSMVAIVA